MAAYEKIPYDKKIEAFVKKYALTGKSLNSIFDLAAAQGYVNMPNSRTTFSKLYKHVVDQVKFDKIQSVADKVYERAVGGTQDNPDGYFPAQELILKTQAGWAVTNVNVEVDANEDDGGDAKAALLAALGIELDKDE